MVFGKGIGRHGPAILVTDKMLALQRERGWMDLEGRYQPHLVRYPGDPGHPPEFLHQLTGPAQPAQRELGPVELVGDLVPVVLPEVGQGRGSRLQLIDALRAGFHLLAGERGEPVLAGKPAVLRPGDLAVPPERGIQRGVGGIERRQELVITVVGLPVGRFVPAVDLIRVLRRAVQVIDARGRQHRRVGRQMHALGEQRVDEAGRVAAEEGAAQGQRRGVVGPLAYHPHTAGRLGTRGSPQRTEGARDAVLHEPHVVHFALLVGLRDPNPDHHAVAVGGVDHVGPAQRRHLAEAHPGHEQQSRDHGIDTATLGGHLLGLDTTPAPARAVARGEHGREVGGAERARVAAAAVGGGPPVAGEHPGGPFSGRIRLTGDLVDRSSRPRTL